MAHFHPLNRSRKVSLLDHIWLNFSLNYISGDIVLDINNYCQNFLSLSEESNSNPSEKIKITIRRHSQ